MGKADSSPPRRNTGRCGRSGPLPRERSRDICQRTGRKLLRRHELLETNTIRFLQHTHFKLIKPKLQVPDDVNRPGLITFAPNLSYICRHGYEGNIEDGTGGDDGHVPAKSVHRMRMQTAQTRKASMSGMPYGYASDTILGEIAQSDGR